MSFLNDRICRFIFSYHCFFFAPLALIKNLILIDCAENIQIFINNALLLIHYRIRYKHLSSPILFINSCLFSFFLKKFLKQSFSTISVRTSVRTKQLGPFRLFRRVRVDLSSSNFQGLFLYN